MPTRSLGVPAALAAAAVVTAAFAVVPATAQDGDARVTIRGGPSVVPGKSYTDNQRFTPRNVSVRSGGTLRVLNRARAEDPHTVSIVRARELPQTAAAMNRCYEGGVCAKLEEAHTGGEEPEGPPKNPVINVGEEGLDQPGDSVVLMDKDERFEVSAAAGTTLRYFCVIHPYMQGRIRVR